MTFTLLYQFLVTLIEFQSPAVSEVKLASRDKFLLRQLQNLYACYMDGHDHGHNVLVNIAYLQARDIMC